ncbi:MAG: isoprenylcysteine carboxylmethyltransferase family protein [bacterium]
MLFCIGAGILAVLVVYCLLGVKKAYGKGETLPPHLSITIWILGIVHWLLVILASFYSLWALPFNRLAGLITGSITGVIGLAIMIAGMIEFHSFRKMSGLEASKLITAGIYRWSRNPQYGGSFILLFGISLIGRSILAFLFVILAIIVHHLYLILLEEPYLERIFEEEYRLYKLRTPRYIGIPKEEIK